MPNRIESTPARQWVSITACLQRAFSFGGGPGGSLGGAAWNQLVSGALMLATVVAGWHRASRSQLRRASAVPSSSRRTLQS